MLHIFTATFCWRRKKRLNSTDTHATTDFIFEKIITKVNYRSSIEHFYFGFGFPGNEWDNWKYFSAESGNGFGRKPSKRNGGNSNWIDFTTNIVCEWHDSMIKNYPVHNTVGCRTILLDNICTFSPILAKIYQHSQLPQLCIKNYLASPVKTIILPKVWNVLLENVIPVISTATVKFVENWMKIFRLVKNVKAYLVLVLNETQQQKTVKHKNFI